MATVLQASLGLHNRSQTVSPGSAAHRLSYSDYLDDGEEDEHQVVLAEVPEGEEEMEEVETDPSEEEEEPDLDLQMDDEEEQEEELEDEELDDPEEDDDHDLSRRPCHEQESIRYEIQEMYDTLPNLVEQYRLTDRLGEGQPTPSSFAVDAS